MAKSELYEKIYAVVEQIPPGRVATYGQVARISGIPGQARLIGYALNKLSDERRIPWHRVINRLGQISLRRSVFESGRLQEEMLRSEGVQFDDQRTIDLKRYRWHE